MIIALALATSVQIAYTILNQKPIGIADKTDNINVMLTRPENWKRFAKNPVISESDMAILDGSTATIPITAELLRQFYGYTDQQVEESSVVFHSTTHSLFSRRKNQSSISNS